MSENNPALRAVPPERHIRFGPFELDTRAGELRKHGIKIRIGQQTLEILIMLLRHPGEVVLREEIRQKLWPLDTVVEFDHSINAAVQKLRDALGESADNPRHIETLPRRGYRFIGTVDMPPAPSTQDGQATPQTPPRNWSPLVFTISIVLLGALALAGWLRPWETRAPATNAVFSLGPYKGGVTISPDGSTVLYYSVFRGFKLRRLDSLVETPIYPSGGPTDTPVWSPDGSHILLRSSKALVSVPVSAGPTETICPQLPNSAGFAVRPDGAILMPVNASFPGTLELFKPKQCDSVRIDVPGFTKGVFTRLEFLPDGKNFLFAWWTQEDEDLGLYLSTLENGRITRAPVLLRRNQTAGHYAPSGGGRFLYVLEDILYAQKLNVRDGKLEGEPERVVEGVHSSIQRREASFSVSRNGVLVWLSGQAELAQPTWFDRTGKVVGTAGPRVLPDAVRMSPDGKHMLLFTLAKVYGVVEENRSGYVAVPGLSSPLWMPDSAHILYRRKDGNFYRVLERAVVGGAEKELAQLPDGSFLCDVAPDGKVLLVDDHKNLYSIRLDEPPGRAKPQMLAAARIGKFSPDGRWILYAAETNGSKNEVYVQPFPLTGLRAQLTSTGGESPVWRGDGKEILFRHNQTIYSMRVEVKGRTVHAGPPDPLFDVVVPSGIDSNEAMMNVTRDGSRILFMQSPPLPQSTNVMTAWDTLLRK